MNILGISAYYHDSAACLLQDGALIAAAQEERFTRKRHDAAFPEKAIAYCLEAANLKITDLECVVFYDKPLLKFDRLLETYFSYAPQGLGSFLMAMPLWIKEKLYLRQTLKKEISRLQNDKSRKIPKILFTTHHQSHAASAFFPSPFKKAAVLCLDGVGEWATTSLWLGDGNRLDPQWEIHFPHSLGLLYSAFTYYAGFKVNSAEYKVMGLAPYGEPRYVDRIWKHLVDLKEDGTFRLNLDYFDFPVGLKMTNRKFDELFDGPPRKPESEVTQKEMDLAKSIQVVTEEIVLRLARSIHRETGAEALCLAGGVALNCVANGRLRREGPFKKIWIQPAAGDAGGAVGAAYAAWHLFYDKPRNNHESDEMRGSYLGPQYHDAQITAYLDSVGAKYERLNDRELFKEVASLLEKENVVGWFQGRMEFGPRSLGARSILGDPRSSRMQSTMNLKIKYRESFRPFAPSVLAEDVHEIFELNEPSPYMLMVADVKKDLRIPMDQSQENLFGIEKLKVPRSKIPAVTHVDYSARIQTVHPTTNPRFHSLLREFKSLSGMGVLVNTSFNVRGEPIVCSPQNAYECFMATEMDCLVLENFLLRKSEQPTILRESLHRRYFELD